VCRRLISKNVFSKSSPSFARKGHKQIKDNEADEKDRIIAGVDFVVRYIGSTEVACASGTGNGKTKRPVAEVFEQYRRNGNEKTQKKVILTLCSRNANVSDEACGKLIASFPISKITFCNTDSFHEKAFVFVARDKPESPFKAFVFACESKTKAVEAFKALSLAFIINYGYYQASLARGEGEANDSPNHDSPDTTFTGGTEVSSLEEEPKKMAHRCDDSISSGLPTNILNPVCPYGGNERTSSPPQSRPENKNLLQVADYRRHNRSSSDPTHLGDRRKTPGNVPSPLAVNDTTPKKTKENETEIEDAEFTEFAKLRSKSQSSSTLGNNYSNTFVVGVQHFACSNVWGGFQKASSSIY